MFLTLVLASPALAASAAEGILQQLQSVAGVAATERNATDLALLAPLLRGAADAAALDCRSRRPAGCRSG